MTEMCKDDVKPFVLGGNAIVTIQSSKTGKHYTYKVRKAKEDGEVCDGYYVYQLYGPENDRDYKYIGIYFADNNYFHPLNTYKSVAIYGWPPAMRAFKYFVERLDDLPDTLFVYHEGRCGRCGRKLTTPESIKSGFGPECRRMQ